MKWFCIFSYLVTVSTFIIFIYIYKKEKYLLVKPSIWFLGFFHVFIQWAAAIYHEDVWLRLDMPYRFFILTQVVPLTTLILTRFTFRTNCWNVWKRFNRISLGIRTLEISVGKYSVFALLMCFGIIGIYLTFVPLSTTGLYVGLTSDNPLLMSIAREKSMKLLPIGWLKYLFAFLEKFLAPITASLLTLSIFQFRKIGMNFRGFLAFVLIVILVLGVMLPGPRLNGVLVLLCCLLTLFFLNIGRVNILKYAGLAVLILIPAVLLQMQKYTDVEQGLILVAFEEVLLRRALYVPMEAGIYWLDYVENFGFWGPAGIPKLGMILGLEPINVPNFLMNYYFDFSEKTGYFVASFIFSYYCFFGPWIIPFLVVGILILDFWVIGYRFIKTEFLISGVVAINLIVFVLTSTDYITLFITYGFLPGLVLLMILSQIMRPSSVKVPFKEISCE